MLLVANFSNNFLSIYLGFPKKLQNYKIADTSKDSHYLDDRFGERFGQLVEKLSVRGLVLLNAIAALDQPGGESLEVTARLLQRQQHNHRQPIEDVVHRGGRKCSPELISVGRLHQRHDRVGDRRANVGAHYDWNCLAHLDD